MNQSMPLVCDRETQGTIGAVIMILDNNASHNEKHVMAQIKIIVKHVSIQTLLSLFMIHVPVKMDNMPQV